MKAWFRQKRDNWLEKRIPMSRKYQFDVNNTFILPTTFGWSVIGISVCLFVLGTNYQNNIILLVCYFSIALLLLSLFQSYFYFTRFAVEFKNPQESYAQTSLYLDIRVIVNQTIPFGQLLYKYNDNPTRKILIDSADSTHAIDLGIFSRGTHSIKRITFKTTYPFGLFKCWTHLASPLDVTVFAKPVVCSTQSTVVEQHDTNGSQQLKSSSSEELQGIREYRPTDPIYHVSWKHVAKGQGLLSKDFAEHVSTKTMLRVADITGQNIESELGKLTFLVNKLSSENQVFGLEIKNQQIIPSHGEAHRLKCLTQLASFRLPRQMDDPT